MAERFIYICKRGTSGNLAMKSPSNLQKMVQGQAKKHLALVVFLNQCKIVCNIIFRQLNILPANNVPSCLQGFFSPEVYHTSGLWKMMVGRLCTFLLTRSFCRGCVSLGEGILWTGFPFHCTNIYVYIYIYHLSLGTFRAFFSSNGHG